MYIEAPIKSGKTTFLIDKYVKLLISGVEVDEILVICENSFKKRKFIKNVLEKLQNTDYIGSSEFSIYTFNGVVYNFLLNNWVLVEEKIINKKETAEIIPDFCGLDVAEFLLKNMLQRKLTRLEEADEASATPSKLSVAERSALKKEKTDLDDYSSPQNLLHQLLRRFRLSVENNLSAEELEEKSKLLAQTFAVDADGILEGLDNSSSDLRFFNYLNQLSLFSKAKEFNYFSEFKNIKYLLVDDFDEMNYLCQDFVYGLITRHPEEQRSCDVRNSKDNEILTGGTSHQNDGIRSFIAYDKDGGARRGYLCANPGGIRHPEERSDVRISKDNEILTGCTSPQNDVNKKQQLFQNILHNKLSKIEGFRLEESDLCLTMYEKAFDKAKSLINQGIKPHAISIITPNLDKKTKLIFREFFEGEGIDFQFLSGTRKLIETPSVQNAMLIIKLVNKGWKIPLKPFELKNLLSDIGIAPFLIEDILKSYNRTKKLPEDMDFNKVLKKTSLCHSELDSESVPHKKTVIHTGQIPGPSWIIGSSESSSDPSQGRRSASLQPCQNPQARNDNPKIKSVNEIYQDFLIFLKSIEGLPLIEQFKEIYKKFPNSDDDFATVVESLKNFNNLNKKLKIGTDEFNKSWIRHIQGAVASDNPPVAVDIRENAVIISTPQRAVDFEIKVEHQIWLDVSNYGWVKDDAGPLYNSWVFQKSWQDEDYTPEKHEELTRQKVAHLLRKLTMCCEGEIFCFSSDIDFSGMRNTGYLYKFLKYSTGEQTFNQITPRPDQRPILEYEKGTMAIQAVPGAGKTTVMIALIIELLKKGVNPESIVVLTYMESAARMFKKRIENSCQNLNKLPHISTIHSLANKIIVENDNFVRLGLSSDFQICSASERNNIFKEVLAKLGIKKDVDNFDGAIDTAKANQLSYRDIICHPEEQRGCDVRISKNNEILTGCTNPQNDIQEFHNVYREYSKALARKNFLDYTDLLVLAVKLLKEYPDIRNYYQQRCQFIIEDEAQDSSKIQQELLEILSGKHKNLIRCGDTNQAITTTFSSADVTGFREFIKSAEQSFEMTSSQRCSTGVYTLANNLVKSSLADEFTKNSFQQIEMKPVAGQNPDIKEAVAVEVFENSFKEKQFIIGKIKRYLQSPAPCHPELVSGSVPHEKTAINARQIPDQVRNDLSEKNLSIAILVRSNNQIASWANILNQNNIKSICKVDTLKHQKCVSFLLAFLDVIANPAKPKPVENLYNQFLACKILKDDFVSQSFLAKLTERKENFIALNPNLLETQNLKQFWWEVNHWLEKTDLNIVDLIIAIAKFYFSDVFELSNLYIFSGIVERYILSFEEEKPTLDEVVGYFKSLLRKTKFTARFLSAEENIQGSVQVMTVHKAKGAEFDVVFMPHMHENKYSYSISLNEGDIDPKAVLKDKIETIATGKSKNLIKEEIEEKMRLIYVGITRAEKYLYLTSNESDEPAGVLEILRSVNKVAMPFKKT